MYNSDKIAERIKARAKQIGMQQKDLFEKAGMGNNTLNNMKTSTPKSDNLAKIADVLDCSVDYLLGRTDNPSMLTEEQERIAELMSALVKLSPEEQKLIMAQIKGIIDNK